MRLVIEADAGESYTIRGKGASGSIISDQDVGASRALPGSVREFGSIKPQAVEQIHS